MKYLTALFLCFFSIGVNAATLETLKKQPASQYDFGKLQLELATYILNQPLGENGKALSDGFILKKYSVIEEDGTLLLNVDYQSYAKNMNNETCHSVLEKVSQILDFKNMFRDIWPGLNENQYKELENEVRVKVVISSRENQSFKIDCK